MTIHYEAFGLDTLKLTKYLFFTGKGGVGKTSTACAVAVNLADSGKKVLLISTDPASNLQDVFHRELNGKGVLIEGVPGLVVANLDPEEAAREYRESVVGPYRGKLPGSVITNMEEQLSGSCTVEIAAFDQFSKFITDQVTAKQYDYIIFDTAPTGHTLRMLQLPSAWSNFITESTHGASCLGQLAGLGEKQSMYKAAVANLADRNKTTLILVSRPEETPLLEVERSRHELSSLGINNQVLIINGVLGEASDAVSQHIFDKQQYAMERMPDNLRKLKIFTVPLRSYNVVGLDKIRAFFSNDDFVPAQSSKVLDLKKLDLLIEDIYRSGKKVVFTMGKGGVGKTTIAATIALTLAQKGVKVHLTSTDPAANIQAIISETDHMTVSKIDEKQELINYQNEVLGKARETMSEDDIAYIEEDLRSPCTQEIAVFRAFAEIVDQAEEEVVVIDTAPTGHTLLLLDSTESYHKEVQRTKGGDIPISVQRLLPRLRDEQQTEVIIVTLPEATPVFEASRLCDDLKRAGIHNKWWVVNQCLTMTDTDNPMLLARAEAEKQWLGKIRVLSADNFVAVPWLQDASVKNIVRLLKKTE